MSAPQHHCKDCGVVFDSGKSLDVHLHYHKENLMTKWGQASSTNQEDNNNVNKKPRAVAADSSEPNFPEYFQQEYQQENSAFQRLGARGYRYQPYQQQPQGGFQQPTQVQCDKCGLVCETNQLAEHVAAAHPPSPGFWPKEEPQAEILDLDSHKVHVYQPPEGEPPDPWHLYHEKKNYFEPEKRYALEENGDSSPDFGGVSTTSLASPEPLSWPLHEGSVSSLGKVAPGMVANKPAAGGWKSNEARRPKTYNCSACNKWFTSSGHLKRHYNTTLHKNAVKQSGVLDPATLPVSAHHHPPKESYASPRLQEEVPRFQELPVPGREFQEFQQYSVPQYPNAMPPHVSSFGNDEQTLGYFQEPLPSFAQFQQNGFAEFVATPDVGGLFETFLPAEEPSAREEVSSTVERSSPVHKCHDCDKTFNKACYLTQHNKSFHSGDKPFKCSRCGKRFTQEYLHLEHLSKHAGDKPYKCEMCPKQFNHKTDLRRHMCLHSGDKPYACEICGKGFIRKDHMLKHCETHKRKHSSASALLLRKRLDEPPPLLSVQ